MDDDLQHPPSSIPLLLERLNQGFDVVYASPIDEQHSLLRNLASQTTKLILQDSMGVAVARKVSAFRMFRTRLRDAFDHYRSPYVSIDVLLTWGTTRFDSIDVQHVPRKYGQSNYTLRKLITHALNMVTGFSVLPLQIASLIGFAFTLFGLLVLIYVVGRYVVEGGVVAGFPFLASIIAIFAGAQLFALGIIGEYIARIHLRSMERPPYTVRQEIATDATAHEDASVE
jgi:undecaprenyl-phosphate 4-deoxy-4-formamido-L-arabinose transferase